MRTIVILALLVTSVRLSAGPEQKLVEDSPKIIEFANRLKVDRKKTDLVLRDAKANELLLIRPVGGKPAVIHNPTSENLVFHVAIKGDEKLRGSQKLSVAHETWLPPDGRLRVPKLYWTTPAMKRP